MQLSDNLRGAALMTGAMTAFTLNDACMKVLGETLDVWQSVFLRGVGTTLCLIVLAVVMGQWHWRLPRKDWGLIALRSVAEAASAWLFLSALFHMEIANVSAILQALPLTVTLAGAIVFGEAVGWKRLVAILIGFCGVLLIVKPGGGDFNVYSVYALLAVVGVTVRDLCARRMSSGVPSLVISVVASAFVTVFAGAGTLVGDWAPIDGRDVALIGGASFFLIGGYIFSVSSMRVGEIGFVAPFRYASLIVAMILGVVVFGTFPDTTRLVGAAIVVATGLFTLWREWVLRRAGRRIPPPPIARI